MDRQLACSKQQMQESNKLSTGCTTADGCDGHLISEGPSCDDSSGSGSSSSSSSSDSGSKL